MPTAARKSTSGPAVCSVALECPSPAQELHHLAELRDLGVITPEEFDIMKARIVHGG